MTCTVYIFENASQRLETLNKGFVGGFYRRLSNFITQQVYSIFKRSIKYFEDMRDIGSEFPEPFPSKGGYQYI
jgi:hypothetical protein